MSRGLFSACDQASDGHTAVRDLFIKATNIWRAVKKSIKRVAATRQAGVEGLLNSVIRERTSGTLLFMGKVVEPLWEER